ncbi:MAG: aspartyl protease family protein [Desulfurococcales archaeon]|nr:aspartyl protease family protein [Desulfurococcales archaeon]
MIRSPDMGKSMSLKALVDTGATLTVVPRKIVEELNLPLIGKRVVATAKGVAEFDECLGVIEIMGRKAYSHMLVSDEIDIVLIDTVTLEILGFEIDPVTGKLKEARIFLL